MAERPFKDVLKEWRLKMSLKEKMSLKQAADVLGVDYPSYRKYETGKRTPCKLAKAQLERMMSNAETVNPD